MTGTDRVVTVPLAGLVLAISGWTLLCLAVPSLRDRLPASLAFLGVAAGCWGLARRGSPRLAGGLFLAVTGGGVCAGVAAEGLGGRMAFYLPLVPLVAVGWLGPRVGGAVVVGLSAFTLTLPHRADEGTDAERAASLAVATVVAAAFVGPLMRELWTACGLAAQRAETAQRALRLAALDEDARDRFLTSVSHELRTPLDAVQGYTELLLEDLPDPVHAADLGRIRRAAVHLASLVDDMIDMARTDGELTVEPDAVVPAELVREVADTTAPLVAAQGSRLRLACPEVPALWTDPRRVRQILLNLVSNAAKYTVDGEVVLTVRTEEGRVSFEVRDTGVGFPPERAHELFRPFVQLHEGTHRRPGVGLGLALSQRLAHRLGGRITARSVVGRGSTFTLELPAAPPRGVDPARQLGRVTGNPGDTRTPGGAFDTPGNGPPP